jgi:predicted PurR-regulated permease PerM
VSSQLPSVTSPPWGTATKRIIALVAVIAIYLITRQIGRAAWTAIVVALVLSYLLSPIVTFFERRLSWLNGYEARRTLSVLLTWIVVIGVFALFIWLIVPATVVQLRQFAEDLPGMIQNSEQDLQTALSKPINIGSYTLVPWDELQQFFAQKDGQTNQPSLTKTLQDAVLSLANPALGVLGGAVSFLLTVFFVLMMLFYLMRDGPRFVEYAVGGVPESYQGDARLMLHELGLIWNAYLRGQIILCSAIATVTYIAALILGLPQPLVLGLVAGFLEFIPNLGPALAQIPALLFALTTSSTTIPALHAGFLFAIVVSLTYVGIQQLEAIFLVPRIMGQSLDLHPFVVLVAILIGANLVGVLGVILAAPSVATLRLFGRYLRGKLLDEELFATTPAYARRQRGMVYRLIFYFLSKRYPPQSDIGLDMDIGSTEPVDVGGRVLDSGHNWSLR